MPKSKKLAKKATVKNKRASVRNQKKAIAARPRGQRQKTSNPEVKVKKAVYSRSLRANVLSSAGARQRLIEMGGENTINIIRDFDRDMSDEELSRRTNIKASDVRVVLNKLHNKGLFAYTRVRDKDSGWYSYIWRMSEDRLKEFSGEESGERPTERTVDAEGDRYRCSACSPEGVLDFDNAMDNQFRCQKCGSALEFVEKRRR